MTVRSVAPAPHSDSDVVILRESEVDNIEEAVRRVRQEASTRNARILIVDSEAEVSDLPAVASPPAVELASRIRDQVECLEQFHAEADRVFDEASGDPAGAVATLRSIQSWSRAVLDEIHAELARVESGPRLLDLRHALHEAATAESTRWVEGDLPIEISRFDGSVSVTAEPAELDELLRLALGLTAERIGRTGRLVVEVDRGERATLTFRGYGSPRPLHGVASRVQRLRTLVRRLGGSLPAPEACAKTAHLTIVLPASSVEEG